MTKPLLLSLGSINADFQFRVGETIEPGRTLLAASLDRFGGGKAANRALIAHRLGHGACLIGQVGGDDLADQALSPLRAAGLDLSHVMACDDAATAVSMIMVPPDGKKTILLAANANDDWTEPHADAALRAIARVPDSSILAIDCEVPIDLVRRAVAAAKTAGLRVVLDPSPANRVDNALLQGLYSITPNPKEAGGILDLNVRCHDDAVEAVKALADKGVTAPCVKLENGGCVLIEDQQIVSIDPLQTEPVDTTGAGDAFAGGLCAALLDGRTIREAAAFAVAYSSLAVKTWGSQDAYVERDAVEAAFGSVFARVRTLRAVGSNRR